MPFSVLRMIACLPIVALANNYALSGKVTGASGNGLAGIWVGLADAKLATFTASDGSWSIGGTSGIAPRTAKRIAVTSHLVREGGRLRFAFEGKDLAGRSLSSTAATAVQAIPATSAARTADVITDTLLYVRDGNLLASTVINSSSLKAGTLVLDTASHRFTYTASARLDTLRVHSFSKGYADIYCSDSTLGIWTSSKEEEIDLIQMTNDGFELSNSGDGVVSNSKYKRVTKFHRLSGSAGSLLGRFYLAGEAYRPMIANVPDSVVKIISEDSVASSAIATKNGIIYEFTSTTLALVGMNARSFARGFVEDWSWANSLPYKYSDQDSAWHLGRGYSDSAWYDIDVRMVDSSTVRLTGVKTQEVVTITGTASASGRGFDMTYSSSNSARATGTRQAIPTSCPEAASWYSEFRQANSRSLTAARIAAPSVMVEPKLRARRWFQAGP